MALPASYLTTQKISRESSHRGRLHGDGAAGRLRTAERLGQEFSEDFRLLQDMHGDRRWSLYPHLEVFGEGVGSLRRGIDAGLLDLLGQVNSRDETTAGGSGAMPSARKGASRGRVTAANAASPAHAGRTKIRRAGCR